MRWLLILVLFPALAFAGEDCSTQLGGKCRESCAAGEVAEQGAEFKKQFTKPGMFSYTCEMHPFMTGKVVVE